MVPGNLYIKTLIPNYPDSLTSQKYIKLGASSRWSSSLYFPMRFSDQMTIRKKHPTLKIMKKYGISNFIANRVFQFDLLNWQLRDRQNANSHISTCPTAILWRYSYYVDIPTVGSKLAVHLQSSFAQCITQPSIDYNEKPI